MDGAWNFRDVKPPSICTVKTVLHFKEMTALNQITFNAFKTLKDLNYLDREAAILSRFLYKHRRVFRHDKGMQNLVKIYQCLKRYLRLDMSGVLHTFKQSLPFKFPQGASYAYLPTRQILKWVLLKFQAFSQIFVRLTKLTKEVGAYFLAKSWLGWGLSFSLTVFSLSARLLGTSKYLIKKSIEWYNSLYKYLPFLQETSEFLPNYNLPTNLEKWLGSVDFSPIKKKTFIDKIFENIDLAKDDEEEQDEDSEVKILHEKFIKSVFKAEVVKEEAKNEKKGVKRPLKVSQYEDLGVPVNVDEEVLERPRKKGKNTQMIKKIKKKTIRNYYEPGGNKNSTRGLRKKQRFFYYY